MDLLANIATCVFVVIGCFEYTTAECAEDVFFAWEQIPCGDRPALCEDGDCLPIEWEGADVRRRILVDCSC